MGGAFRRWRDRRRCRRRRWRTGRCAPGGAAGQGVVPKAKERTGSGGDAIAARADAGRTAGRPGLARPGAGPGASLRSWFAIRCRRLSQGPAGARDCRFHESQGRLLGKPAKRSFASLQARGRSPSQRADGIGQRHGLGRVRPRRALPDSCRSAAGTGRILRLQRHGTSSLVLGQAVTCGFRAALACRRVADRRGRRTPAVSSADHSYQ